MVSKKFGPNFVQEKPNKTKGKEVAMPQKWAVGGRGPKQKKHGRGTAHRGRYLSSLLKSEAAPLSF